MDTRAFLLSQINYRLNDIELQYDLSPYGGMVFATKQARADYINDELDQLVAAEAIEYYAELYLDVSSGLLTVGNANLANSVVALALGMTLTAPSNTLTVKGKHFNISEVFEYFYVDDGSSGSNGLFS